MKKLNSNSSKLVPETLTGISIFIILSLFMVLSSCESFDSDGIHKEKQSDFESPEEFMDNSSISDAIDDSGIEINNGKDAPSLIGDYHAVGTMTDADYSIGSLIGTGLNSMITLYAQTPWASLNDQNSPWGKISYRERINGLTANASGGYVTGSNSEFTIWQESVQSGADAGLPDDVTLTVALIMSGKKFSSGNLKAEGLSIITKVVTDNLDYDADKIVGVWWKWEADFAYIGLPNIN